MYTLFEQRREFQEQTHNKLVMRVYIEFLNDILVVGLRNTFKEICSGFPLDVFPHIIDSKIAK